MNEEEISSIPKSDYKNKIKALIRNAAFGSFLETKSKHKKLDNISYPSFQIQPYLTSSKFNNKERELLYLLRSHCYKSKINLKKTPQKRPSLHIWMFRCEDQNPIFTNCQPIRSQLNITENVKYENIFRTVQEQNHIMPTLMKIEEARKHMKTHFSPGGVCSQDLCKFSTLLDYAADSNLRGL